MKILFFDDFRLGVLKDDVVVDVTSAVKDVPHLGPHDLINGVIAQFRPIPRPAGAGGRHGPRRRACQGQDPPAAAAPDQHRLHGGQLHGGRHAQGAGSHQRLPQVARCDHAANGDTMVLPDVPATHFEGEAELAVVIGKGGYQIKAADAMNHVFGYTNFIDGSARGLKPPGNTFYQMKSRRTFAPIGPYIVTADEIKDPNKLQVRLWNNGELKQNFNTDDMAQQYRALHRVLQLHPRAGAGRHPRDRHQSPRPARLPGWRPHRARDRGARPAARQRARRPQAHAGRATRGLNGRTRAARAASPRNRAAATRTPRGRRRVAALAGQLSTPTIAPIRQVASVPDTIDFSPSDTMSSRRSGAMVAMPPIMMPSEPKLAKPHMA